LAAGRHWRSIAVPHSTRSNANIPCDGGAEEHLARIWREGTRRRRPRTTAGGLRGASSSPGSADAIAACCQT
jgi:hypothetical protein